MPAGRPKSTNISKLCKVCGASKAVGEFHQHRLICKCCRKMKDHQTYMNKKI